jgi:FlaA1/EpsC-like NDP-sugar epimerase
VSTDKACAPINVYGMCKAISERVVLEKARHFDKVKFVVVRYGNVLESRGSIVPLFKYQSENSDAITITRKDMTRFLMTLDDSVDLIFNAIIHGKSGDTWIPKLKSMRINDLAKIFSNISGKPIREIGVRSGEKIHELLVNDTESLRTLVLDDFYIIKSAIENKVYNKDTFEYGSHNDVKSILIIYFILNCRFYYIKIIQHKSSQRFCIINKQFVYFFTTTNTYFPYWFT